jgi:hypothetical protein
MRSRSAAVRSAVVIRKLEGSDKLDDRVCGVERALDGGDDTGARLHDVDLGGPRPPPNFERDLRWINAPRQYRRRGLGFHAIESGQRREHYLAGMAYVVAVADPEIILTAAFREGRVDDNGARICRISLKAKPTATEPTPSPASRSTGRTEGNC